MRYLKHSNRNTTPLVKFSPSGFFSGPSHWNELQTNERHHSSNFMISLPAFKKFRGGGGDNYGWPSFCVYMLLDLGHSRDSQMPRMLWKKSAEILHPSGGGFEWICGTETLSSVDFAHKEFTTALFFEAARSQRCSWRCLKNGTLRIPKRVENTIGIPAFLQTFEKFSSRTFDKWDSNRIVFIAFFLTKYWKLFWRCQGFPYKRSGGEYQRHLTDSIKIHTVFLEARKIFRELDKFMGNKHNKKEDSFFFGLFSTGLDGRRDSSDLTCWRASASGSAHFIHSFAVHFSAVKREADPGVSSILRWAPFVQLRLATESRK